MTATAEQIKEWKDKYKDVYMISVDERSCYLRRPTRKELSYATMAAKNDPLKFNEVILSSCWLDGDDEIKTDDYLFLGASTQIANIVQVKEAELKKL